MGNLITSIVLKKNKIYLLIFRFHKFITSGPAVNDFPKSILTLKSEFLPQIRAPFVQRFELRTVM